MLINQEDVEQTRARAEEHTPTVENGRSKSARRGPLDILAKIVKAEEHRIAALITSSIYVSFAVLEGVACVCAKLCAARLAESLNRIGHASAKAGVMDPQVFMQKRLSKAGNPDEIWGVIVDVDRPTADILGEVETAGLSTLMPNAAWHTRNGFKLAFAFNQAALPEDAQCLAEYAVVAIGADMRSASTAQAQHLPVCMKSVDGAAVHITHEARQTNATPFEIGSDDLHTEILRIPPHVEALILEALGSSAPSLSVGPQARLVVERYLEELGISAPDDIGGLLQTTCPMERHDKRCCYVNRRSDSSIDVRCLGHEDAKHWSEVALHAIATGESQP